MCKYTPMEIYLARLAQAIEKYNQVTLYYAKLPNAKPDNIKNRNDFSNSLAEPLDGIVRENQIQGIVSPFATKIHRLLETDPETGIVALYLTVRPNKFNISRIDHNPFNLC